MKLTKLALIALLGGTLTVLGCGSSSGGGGDDGGEPDADTDGGTPDADTDAGGGAILGGVTNPESCEGAGNIQTHQVVTLRLQGAEDGNPADDELDGVNLDGVDGSSCGGPPAAEGAGGVDNGMAGLLQLAGMIGSSPAMINQGLQDSVDDGSVDIQIRLNPSASEDCAVAELLLDGEVALTINANFNATTGDASVVIDSLGLSFPAGEGDPIPLEMKNVVLIANVDENGFAGKLGGSFSVEAVSCLAEALQDLLDKAGLMPVIQGQADIREDLATTDGCNAISATIQLTGELQE